MRDIRISPKTQVLATLGLVGGIAAAVAAQLPELRRYLKIETM
jgi:hypothetical protein